MPSWKRWQTANRLRSDVEDPFTYAVAEDTIDPRHRTLRDKNWQKVSPLLVQQPAIFLAEQRGRIIASQTAETGEEALKPVLYRLLRRYWQRGMTPNAFLPDFDKCGWAGTRQGSIR